MSGTINFIVDAATLAAQQAQTAILTSLLAAAVATQASQAALVTANHADLASILGKILTAPATESTLSAAKTDLDTLLTNVATAAKQDTGNTALANLHTDLAALIAANHTDEGALLTVLATLHTDSAAILAKQPASPSLDRTTAAIPFAVRQSDGSGFISIATSALQTTINNSITALIALFPASLGQKAAALALAVVNALANYNKASTCAIAGVQIKATAGSALYAQFENTTGGAVFLQIHDALPAGGARPVYFSASVNTGAATSGGLGHATYGVPCQSTIYLVFSSTGPTYTAIASTSVAYTLHYL